MLKGSDQCPFARCERHEEFPARLGAGYADRAGNAQWNPRKAYESFDASRQLRRFDLRAAATDLIDVIASFP
jgi:hypothetical protein